MEKQYSNNYGAYLNKDNFLKRELLLGVCIRYALFNEGLSEDVIPCIDIINNLDDNFPFDIISIKFIEDLLLETNLYNGSISRNLIEALEFLRKMYSPKNYKEVLETFDAFSSTFIDVAINEGYALDERYIALYKQYDAMDDYIVRNTKKPSFFAMEVYKYIAGAMYAEAYINKIDDVNYIGELMKDILENFDPEEFTIVRGIYRLENNYIDLPADKSIMELLNWLDRCKRDEISDYIYQYIKEEYYKERPVIR